MTKTLKVLIIGGVACGTKTASRLKRLCPQAQIVIIEKGSVVSYGACGLTYYVEGLFPRIEMLCETPVGVARTPEFFAKAKGVEVRTSMEAQRIDRDNKTVLAKNLATGQEERLDYDKLVIATGATAIKPSIEGANLQNIWQVRELNDAETMVKQITAQQMKRAVIIGAGYIGIEMAEALVARGLDVTVIEIFDQIMPRFLDYEFATIAANHLRQKGVKLVLKERVIKLLGKDNKVTNVVTDNQTLPADLVVMAIGVRPNDKLARESALSCSPAGGILINSYCQTSDPDIYAGGDCVLNSYIDSTPGKPLYVPLGSTANKHGRIIADHIADKPVAYPGISSTGICKAFDFTLARTGLTEKEARALHLDIETAIWVGPEYPHYYPDAKPLFIKLVASRRTHKLLGAQVIGMGEVAKRVDVAATSLHFGATVDQLAEIDLAYAPPYAPPIDPIAVAAHVLINKLDGLAHGISPLVAKKRMDAGDDIVLLDVRTPQECELIRIDDPRVVNIPLGALRSRLHELPKDKDILAFCKISLRGYEAQRILNAAGFDQVCYIEGGVVGWPFEVWTS